MILLLVVAGVSDLAAHDTWLIADRGTARVGETIRLSLTSGELFPADDFAIEPTRVVRAIARIADSTQPMMRPSPGAMALGYLWKARRPGVVTIGVELAPKTLTHAPDKIEEYLTEIDATSASRALWKSMGGKRPWVESYVKHAVTYLRIGDSRDSSWSHPLGFGLEIVPEGDPTTVRASRSLGVRVMRNGQPLRDFAVGALRAGETHARFFRTDSLGRARLTFAASGRWLLNGTDLRPSNDRAFTWQSDFVTTTLHVLR